MRTRILAVISVLSVAALLGGCSLLGSGVQRDSQGRVTESATISARDLQVGDCFSFNSADGGIVEEVTVKPCSTAHDYIIIGQGKLTASDITAAGSLQNAVSASCAPAFDEFKAKSQSKEKPKQEFMVFPETNEPDANQLYSCMSTDPDQNFVTPTPTPTGEQTPAP